MNTLGKFVSSLNDAFEFNQATLSGSIDVVVVKQRDGSLKSTPFHVRFGKLKVLKSKDKIVKLTVNHIPAKFNMKLGEAGEAFFEEEITKPVDVEYFFPNEECLPVQMIIPEAQSPELVKEQQNVNANKNLKALLTLKHTASNASTSAQSNGANDICDPYMNIEDPKAIKLSPSRPSSSSPVKERKTKTIRVRTLRPSSEQLQSLNLKHGLNTITYTVESSLQGTQTLISHIYCWPHDAQIIVSDIDGTITKTDFMGHLMSVIGKDWSQPGIAPLYQNIRRNGYFILYLTSRAIGQAGQTRDFLQSVYQDGKMLPHGPMIMSPDRMLPSVKRELLYKRPEVFKMAALKDIKSLFPADHNPFHAGFGNRETDAIAYRSVGVSLDKVFIVNPKGHIHHHHHSENIAKSYALINAMIKDIFPGISKDIPVPESNILKLDNKSDLKANVEKVVC